jgi:N-acetylmuramoyl-L-alanine amidase
MIRPDGEAVHLLPIDKVSNGVAGFNSVTINMSYIGGVDANNKPIDNRTAAQKVTMLELVKGFKKQFPKAIVQGHRDFPNVHKDCPSFNAKKEFSTV